VREQRLLREAEAAARLAHPNIVTLFDVGRCEQGPYLVLEMLRGETLAQRLSQGRLPLGEALRIGGEVAKGLAHAHAQGVVHRDLTPGNVYLCQDGQVKVLDLGMAHAFGRRKLDGGTPAYMAPEQARGAPEDERTDVFALGVILFQMLAGERPFEDERALESRWPAPALEVPLEPALGELVARMLSKEAPGRPRDAGEVLAALLAFQREMDGNSEASRTIVRRSSRLRVATLVAAGVALGAGGAALVARQRRPQAPEQPPSVAVLPFVDMSPANDQGYFADGVSEEILNGLARVEGLRVSGRSSSFWFRNKEAKLADIGRELHVGHVLEGSVRRAAGRVRITAQVVHVATGYQVWSQEFEGNASDTFAIQDEIAQAVVEALKVRVLPGRGPIAVSRETALPEAHNLYLRGMQFLRQDSADSYRRAEEAFQGAVALDPRYATALAGLSRALLGRYNHVASGAEIEQIQARALAAAEKAVELGPSLPQGYEARARIRYVLRDWVGARADVERALLLNPQDADSLIVQGGLLTWTGRPTQAIPTLRKATEIDPLSTRAWMALGIAYCSASQLDLARQVLTRALLIAPDSDLVPYYLSIVLLESGRPDAALAVAGRSKVEWVRLSGEALAQYDLGRSRKSQVALDSLASLYGDIAAYQIAEVHARRGERDEALEWLQRAYSLHDAGLAWVKCDPMLVGLRQDPRYSALLRKMNLPLD
jgi:serine/threonine-protein kinase